MLGLGTLMVSLRFLLESFFEQLLQNSITNMLQNGSKGFIVYFFFSNLCSELFCYFAVIYTIYNRRKHDWAFFETLSVKPKPE